MTKEDRDREGARSPWARPAPAWSVAFLLFAGVVLVDAGTPWQFGFSAFYVLPVLWLAWHRGTREALGMALVAGAAWFLVDLASGRPLDSELFRVWNGLNRLLSYLLIAWVVGALRRSFQAQRALTRRLNAAMEEVRELEGLLPVCAWCHNIRDEEGHWQTLESFLSSRTRASTTHGICPSCAREMQGTAPARAASEP